MLDFILPLSDTEFFFSLISDHSDISLNFDTEYRIDQSDMNLADIGLIRHPIFRIINRFHTYRAGHALFLCLRSGAFALPGRNLSRWRFCALF